MADLSTLSIFDVTGKVIVITGGGTGIGLMMSTALENNGATVYILGRRLEILENAVKHHAKHGKMIPIQCDVTEKQDLIRVTEKIKAEAGKVDVLVVNSGVMSEATHDFTPEIKADVTKLREFWMAKSQEEWARTFSVNVTSVFFTTVAFLELLDAANKARTSASEPTAQVVITSSIGGFMRVTPFAFTYNASKAATTHLGKMLASFFTDYDIRVNMIAPGMYPSSMTGGKVDGMDETNKVHLQPIPKSVIPLGRAGDDEEMAGTILYLASKAGAYCNGSVMVTDGGRMCSFPSTY
ncbi:uncharacterized protein V1516DRAFT_678958 [Lipomyces oligophaga]|uniref:uncharacterized protein n=1 Tax=Lipomyces oligophaga TaxID=45792 RepID=UPI0034CDDF10